MAEAKTQEEGVTLKNGAEEHHGLVKVLCGLVLPKLMEEDPITFYELVMLARDSKHKIFSDVQKKKLQDLNLLEQTGGLHSSTANIVRCAVDGEGLKMRLVNPLQYGGVLA